MSDQPLVLVPVQAGAEVVEGEQSSSDFQAGQVASIAVGHVTHDIYSAFLVPLLPAIRSGMGLSYTEAGGLSIFTQIPSLLNPLIGYIADRVSVRYFVIFAPAVFFLPKQQPQTT